MVKRWIVCTVDDDGEMVDVSTLSGVWAPQADDPQYVLASDYDALAEQLDIAKKARLKPDCALQDRITALLADLARTQEVSRMANATAEKLAERVKGLESALRDGVAVVHQRERRSAHWDGCVSQHKSCAWLERVERLTGEKLDARGQVCPTCGGHYYPEHGGTPCSVAETEGGK